MPTPRELARHRLRSHVEARILDASAEDTHRLHGRSKQAVIGQMAGTVVELGPGTGVNMRYYAPGTHVIGIEPNPHMHERLRAQAHQHGIDLEIRTLRGEELDVADGEADGVVGTLVLCGVDDPPAVLREVRRVLKAGATYFFIEHVVAPEGSPLRQVQRIVKPAHRWVANGCEVDRDTAMTIHEAGFANVHIEHLDTVPRNLWVRHQIVGTATK